MASRVHFIDVPPPDVIWLTAGEHAAPQARSGAKVTAGQVVGGVEHTTTVAVTPLAGEVGLVRTVTDSRGRRQEAVAVLVADDAEHQPPPTGKPARLSGVGREDLPAWIDRLERAGVRADRHNSPDLIRQLLAAVRRPTDTVLCHTLEADPTLPLQSQWALRHPQELRDGLRLLARLVGARRTIVGVGDADHRRLLRHLKRRPTAAEGVSGLSGEPATVSGALPELLRPEPQTVIVPFEPLPTAPLTLSSGPKGDATAPAPTGKAARARAETLGIRLVPVRNTYPQADPTLLVYALAGRRLSPGRLPTDAGVIMLDAVAAVAVGMVARGASVIRREPVAVRDHRSDVSVLADAWRGSRLIDVLRMLGLIESESDPVAVRGGDFLRDRPLPPDCVLDGGELVLHLTVPPGLPVIPESCIRCGWCLDICPTHVHPAGVLEAAQRQDAALADRFGIAACVECGLCSYVCPSRLPLLGAVRTLRTARSQ